MKVVESGAVVSGKVARISRTVDPASATVKVELEIANPGSLRGGMRAHLALTELESDK